MLRATDVTQAFGDEQVLEELSLTVDTGEVVAVIGPSGVGKTTLLRLFALSSRPDAGTITLNGTDPWAVDTATRRSLRRTIGMVFQEASLFDTSVKRNVEYGLRVRRSWRDRIRDALPVVGTDGQLPAAVDDALDVVGLTDKMGQHAHSLSGGEAQRVSFARALAYEPAFLLLDEPTSDLDPRNTAVIEEAIGKASDRDIGVVVATHDMHQARRIADRVAVLLGNRITEVGPPEDIFEDPDDDRTRQFIAGELVY